MLKNSIVHDNNIVNICFKVKAKKDNGQMRAWGWTKNFGEGGGTGLHGGDNPLMGMGPPHTGKPCPPHDKIHGIPAIQNMNNHDVPFEWNQLYNGEIVCSFHAYIICDTIDNPSLDFEV